MKWLSHAVSSGFTLTDVSYVAEFSARSKCQGVTDRFASECLKCELFGLDNHLSFAGNCAPGKVSVFVV